MLSCLVGLRPRLLFPFVQGGLSELTAEAVYLTYLDGGDGAVSGVVVYLSFPFLYSVHVCFFSSATCFLHEKYVAASLK